MKRTVILEFPDYQFRTDFIDAMKLHDYTLHKEKPILFCRLNKEGIKTAINNFGAKDVLYQEPPGCLAGWLFGWLLDLLPWL